MGSLQQWKKDAKTIQESRCGSKVCGKMTDDKGVCGKMTDDKVVSEGPYTTGLSEGLVFKDNMVVESFDSERDKLNACRLANAARAEGRKAERERNWKTVAELCGVNPAERRPCIDKVKEKFWCPVCVCAGKIRGGQDGK